MIKLINQPEILTVLFEAIKHIPPQLVRDIDAADGSLGGRLLRRCGPAHCSARFRNYPDPLPKGPEVEARHAVAAEARLPDFLLAVLNFDDAARVGLLEPLFDLVEQSSDGIAPLLDHGLPGLAF